LRATYDLVERPVYGAGTFVSLYLAGHIDEPLELLGSSGLGLRGMSYVSRKRGRT
jgi:hypothetical protein